jgi:aspartate carbamoyltransferase catalytic subunit
MNVTQRFGGIAFSKLFAKRRTEACLDRFENTALICIPMPTSTDRSTPLCGFSGDRGISSANGSLLDTRTLSTDDILSIFRTADELEAICRVHGNFFDPRQPRKSKTIALMFFEPSTRTRMSFQMATYRLGFNALAIEPSASSLTKGETFEDTILNVAAMKPDAMVVRYGRSEELDQLLPNLPMPVINAGSGTLAHPTQSLLDAYTIAKECGRVEGQKVLVVGDIRHSRVARSNFDVLKKLGAEIGVCGPEEFLPESAETEALGLRRFSKLDEAVEWASVYMGLRIQLERHENGDSLDTYRQAYHSQFGLNETRLKKLSRSALIMHPGPINHGVEFAESVVKDSRSRVMKQVENGVLIRAALLSKLDQTGSEGR